MTLEAVLLNQLREEIYWVNLVEVITVDENWVTVYNGSHKYDLEIRPGYSVVIRERKR